MHTLDNLQKTQKKLHYIYGTEDDLMYRRCLRQLWLLRPKNKRWLEIYLELSKGIQKDIVELLHQNTFECTIRIKHATACVVEKESYVIFYKRHILKQSDWFQDIDMYVAQVKQYLIDFPLPKAIYD